MSNPVLTDALLVTRDAIFDALMVRKGEVLTEELCRERAANGCHYVVEALIDAMRARIEQRKTDAAAAAIPGQDALSPATLTELAAAGYVHRSLSTGCGSVSGESPRRPEGQEPAFSGRTAYCACGNRYPLADGHCRACAMRAVPGQDVLSDVAGSTPARSPRHGDKEGSTPSNGPRVGIGARGPGDTGHFQGAVPQRVTSEITPAGLRAFGETMEEHAGRIIK